MKLGYTGESKILHALCTEVNRLTEDAGTIRGNMGNLERLTTTDKSSLVSAVNEVRSMIDGILEGAS